MKNKKIVKSKEILLAISLAVILLSLSLVSAGVAFKKVVEVYPGETTNEKLILQNLGEGNPDLTFEISVREGSDLVSFGSTKVNVLNGEIKDVPLTVRAPSGAAVGELSNVKVVFRAVPMASEALTGQGSGLQFIKSVGISFDVKVVEKPAERPAAEELGAAWILLIVIIVVAIIAIIYFFIKNKRNKPAVKGPKSAKPAK